MRCCAVENETMKRRFRRTDVAAQPAERRHQDGPETERKVFGFRARQPQRSGEDKVFARAEGEDSLHSRQARRCPA